VIVADTNLIAYLLILGQYLAPLLWRSEFRNILLLYVRRGLMDLNDAYGTMEQAERLMRGQEFEVVSARGHIGLLRIRLRIRGSSARLGADHGNVRQDTRGKIQAHSFLDEGVLFLTHVSNHDRVVLESATRK